MENLDKNNLGKNHFSQQSATMVCHDTLTRITHPIIPMDGKLFRFYCCGPTVYGPAHIGNFRTFLMQDLFRRVLEVNGTATRHVRNITDVDDKTIRQSQAEGRTLKEFTEDWTDQFHKDCSALNLLPPHVEPSAVVHIPEQIELIQRLIEKGHAYRVEDGSVYFRVDSFADYGRLSRLKEREITTNQVEREQSDEYQRDSAADFALWKTRRPEDGENYWESPWGQGRPGWHIECSAMAIKHLGESFDLHSGGVDLIFPHHENEIAQSEAATGKPFVRHWFHIAHLMVDGAKMSKSLGNLYTLSDIEKAGFSPEELRYVLMSGSYRQPLNFTWDSLSASRKALARLREFGQKIGMIAYEKPIASFQFFPTVMEALRSDLNVPEALGCLFTSIKTILHSLQEENFKDEDKKQLKCEFSAILWALGLTLPEPAEVEIPTEVLAIAEKRWQARLAKDWGMADQMRQELAKAGWSVKDAADSYQLTPLS